MSKKKTGSIIARLVITFIGLGMIVLYKISVHVAGLTKKIYDSFTAPVHRVLSRACDVCSFSVAEVLIALAVVIFAGYTVYMVIGFFRNRTKLRTFLSWTLTCVMLFCVIYGGFCVLWGTYYSVSDAEEIYGFTSDGVEHDDLIKVDRYFVDIANEYSARVDRDENGHYIADEDEIFSHAYDVYDKLEQEYPGLKGTKHRAKPVMCSKIMSLIGFTGFFFPFTAEANINIDSPKMMVPATIAHEYAHQRGVAAEDEADFTAILACLSDGDDDFVYSASLLALIHLQNALYKSGDEETWQEIRDSYADGVVTDLADNSAYWKEINRSIVNKISDNTYDAFLKSYDQKLGRETYGACVDLLVDYFK